MAGKDGWRLNALIAAGLGLAMAGSAAAFDPPAAEKPAEPPKEPAKEPAKEKGPSLKVGDKAPALSIETWVKGDPVTGFEKGRVYVVEFWATWCPPCRESIPHLTEMAHKFKKDNVAFVGITSTDEDLETVKAFVKKMGDKMDYSVGVDKGAPSAAVTDKAWMQAAGEDGIPAAFVVGKDQTIAWIGHPMDGLDKVVEQVVAGTFDGKKAAAERAKKREAEEAMQKAMEELQQAAMNEDWDKAGKILDGLMEKGGDTAKMAATMKFQLLLMGKKDEAGAYAHAAKVSEGILKDDAMALNQISWTILDAPGLEKRDLSLALKIAERACEVSKNENGMILDTLARAHYEKGDLDKAIEWQTKAVAKGAPMDEVKTEMEETLARYKKEKADKEKPKEEKK